MKTILLAAAMLLFIDVQAQSEKQQQIRTDTIAMKDTVAKATGVKDK